MLCHTFLKTSITFFLAIILLGKVTNWKASYATIKAHLLKWMGFFITRASCNVYYFSLIGQGNNKSTWWMGAIYPKGIKKTMRTCIILNHKVMSNNKVWNCIIY
jgi:hypothetical protein